MDPEERTVSLELPQTPPHWPQIELTLLQIRLLSRNQPSQKPKLWEELTEYPEQRLNSITLMNAVDTFFSTYTVVLKP